MSDRATVTARIPESLKDDYDAALDAAGRSITEDIQQHVESVVRESREEDVGGVELPENDELRRAMLILDGLAAPEKRSVECQVAESRLAQKLGRPKDNVRTAVLSPLRKKDFIVIRAGYIYVREVSA